MLGAKVTVFSFLLTMGVLLAPSPFVFANEKLPETNRLILEAVLTMPRGGGFITQVGDPHPLTRHVKIKDGRLKVNTQYASPSYCTLATYLVFAKLIERLQAENILQLPMELLEKLKMKPMRSGAGIWGRWNANGPGFQVLFHELKLAQNFESLDAALPGDFMKIYWARGKKVAGPNERGHVAVFLKHEKINGKDYLTFWSSQKEVKHRAGGFGIRRVSLKSMHRVVFSRLKAPHELAHGLVSELPNLAFKNDYLASLSRKDSSLEEANAQAGVVNVPSLEVSASHDTYLPQESTD